MKKFLTILGVSILIIIVLGLSVSYFLPGLLFQIQNKSTGTLNKRIDQANDVAKESDIKIIQAALSSYYQNTKQAPKSLQDLVVSGYIREVPVPKKDGSQISYQVLIGDARICEAYYILSTGRKVQAFCVPASQ